MAKIPKEVIEEIVSRIDLLSYLEDRGINFKQEGSSYKAKCPLPDHNDSTPSFSVKEGEQYFNCFGCDTGGDVITFIMEYDGLTFPEAMKSAADYAGYNLEEELFSKKEIAEFKEMDLLKGIYYSAAKYCHDVMPKDIRDHLKNHYGFTDEFMKEQLIGFDDGNLYNFLKNEMGYSKEELLKSGLFIKLGARKVKDFLETRIMFWYWKRGYPVYAIGRKTEYTKQLDQYEKYEKAKYKKLATHTDNKQYISEQVENRYIYNEDVCLNPRNRPSYVIITEGITDAQIAQMKDIPVISPVTKSFRKSDLKKLKKLVKFIDRVYIVNDNEENGEGLKGALKSAKFLNSTGKEVNITLLPRPDDVEKVDLNMFLQDKSKEEFEVFLSENSKTYHDFLLDEAIEYKEANNQERFFSKLDNLLLEAKTMDPIPQGLFFNRLSERLDLPKGNIKKHFKRVVKDEKQKPEYQQSDDFTEELLEKAKEQADSVAQKLFKKFREEMDAKFFRTGETDVTMILDGKFYDITANESPFTMFLMTEFNLNRLDHKTRKTIWEFKSKAYMHATKMKKQTWLYCDKYDKKIYIGMGSNTTQILKITPDETEKVFNGEDGGIFVEQADDIMEPWDFDPNINQKKAAQDLFDLYVDYMPLKEEDTLMVLFTTLAMPLKRYTDTSPLIKVHGESSSGKTQIAKQIVNLFYGNDHAVGDMTDASKFDQASVRPIMIFDNKEVVGDGQTEKFLLYSATGGVREKRDRNTERGTIKQIVDTLSIITAIHPFEKKELLNRSFDLTADKKFHQTKRDITTVNDEVARRRDEFLSLWMFLVQEGLKNVEQINERKNKIVSNFGRHFKERLNGYYALMWQVAESFLTKIGWSEKEVKVLVYGWIDQQSSQGSDNEKETSPIFRYLSTLASKIRRGRMHEIGLESDEHNVTYDQKTGDVSFEITANDLLNCFLKMARDLHDKFPYNSTNQLMSRLKNDIDVLEENHWNILLKLKKISGINVHRFHHELVDGDSENDEDDKTWPSKGENNEN